VLRIASIAVAWLLMCACSSTPTPTCSTGVRGAGGGGASGPDTPLAQTGKPFTLPVHLPLTVVSCGGDPVSTRADVAVLDPRNQNVAASATNPTVQDSVVSTTVTFTPLTPGPYHVSVRFEPSLGIAQADLIAVLDKTGEAPVVMGMPPGVTCAQIDVEGDTLLCLDVAHSPSQLNSIHGATVVQNVSASAFAYSQGSVWTLSETDNWVHLFGLNPDGTLTEKSSLSMTIQGQVRFMPHGDRVLIADAASLTEVLYAADAGFAVTSLTTISNLGGMQWLPEVGAVAIESDAVVCGVPLDAGEAAAGCGTSGVSVLGFDDDGVWWADPSITPLGSVISVTGWHDGLAPSTASISQLPFVTTGSFGQWTPQASPLLRPASASGAASSEVFLPHLVAGAVVMEQYPPLDDVVHADSKRLWVEGTDTLTWYPR
jgi:hypothetical protein